MEYSIQCPSPCNYQIKVEAKDDDEAVEKIMQAGMAHQHECEVGKKMNMSEEQIKGFVRSNMKKGSCACMAK